MVKDYETVVMSEVELEEVIRREPELIEEGLRFVDHQVPTVLGRIDVLLVTSEGALSVCELKVVEDDGMLTQAIDYYDYVVKNIHAFARGYPDANIDPSQEPFLELIAPSFSSRMLNRCTWIDIPIGLWRYTGIKVRGSKFPTAVFSDEPISPSPQPPESRNIEDRFAYITDVAARKRAEYVVKQIESWEVGSIVAEAIKHDISIKRAGSALAVLAPRRKFFWLTGKNSDSDWQEWKIEDGKAMTIALGEMRSSIGSGK